MDSLRAKAKVGNIDALNQQKVWDMHTYLHKLQKEEATKHETEFSLMKSSTQNLKLIQQNWKS